MVLNQKKENISLWDGTLSPSEFYVGASAFAEKWRLLHHALPPWSWIPCSRVPWPSSSEVDGYLSLEKFNIVRSSEDDREEAPNEIEEANCSGKGEPFDNAVVVQSCSPEVYYCDFHIVYSASYKVPVLYFRVYSGDGQTIELNNIEKFLPVSSAKALRESKWTFITQEEHPYLRRPWFTLHPCGTGEWMKLLLLADTALAANGFTSEHYLVSWMSVVGQEHPYLRRPWFTLHPCGTGEWMKLLLLADTALAANGFTSEHYLVSWMSVVGQVVGLQIPYQLLNS